jgi:hypothetical protein
MTKEKIQRQMTLEDAQACVMGEVDSMFERMVDGPRGWRSGGAEASERLAVYKDIAETITGRDLPEDRVNDLVLKMINLEWAEGMEKKMKDYLRTQGLTTLAGEFNRGDSDEGELLEKVFSLFPQATEIICNSFRDVVDRCEERQTYLVSSAPWSMESLLLVNELNFSEKDKQTIAMSWLAGYFIYGKEMMGIDVLSTSEMMRWEGRRAVELFLKMFDIGDSETSEVAQSVVDQLSKEKISLSVLNDFLDHVSATIDSPNLDWRAFNETKLIETLDNTRKEARLTLPKWEESPGWNGKQGVKLDLFFAFAYRWCEQKIASNDTAKFGERLNQMSDRDFFEHLDQALIWQTEVLGGKLEMDEGKLMELLANAKGSDQISKDVEDGISQKRELKKAEKEQMLKEMRDGHQRELALALEMTKKTKS